MGNLQSWSVDGRDDATRHPGYRVSDHGPSVRIGIGDLDLDAGGSLRGAEIGVVTLGELNPRRDNAVLLTTWYSGSHAPYVRNYVGAGRAIDPARHFVIIANQLGNGFSTSSIDPDREEASLPALSIADDVVAQERVVRGEFGIERLALVLGCSMGAMQAYEWAVRFPNTVARIAAVAGTATPTPYAEIIIRSLLSSLDRGPDGDVASALLRHADLWALFGYTDDFWNRDGWRELGFASAAEFRETSYLPLMTSRSIPVLRDLAGKWARAGRYRDGSAIQLEAISASAAVIPVSSDLVFPPADCRLDAQRIPGAHVSVIDSSIGHLGILGLSATYRDQFDRVVGELLNG